MGETDPLKIAGCHWDGEHFCANHGNCNYHNESGTSYWGWYHTHYYFPKTIYGCSLNFVLLFKIVHVHGSATNLMVHFRILSTQNTFQHVCLPL
jgi:hypothetical protein